MQFSVGYGTRLGVRRIGLANALKITLTGVAMLSGCATSTPQVDSAVAPSQALTRMPVAPIPSAAAAAEAATGPVANVAARVQSLLPLDALLLGEQHDAPDHQRIHREVIEALAARGQLAAVVIEMAMQGNSTASLANPPSQGGQGGQGSTGGSINSSSPDGSSATETAVRAALKWDEKAWPWAAYAPAIMAAVRAGVPVLGSNMPRSQMGAAMQQPDLDQRLSGPALKAQQQLIRAGHCNLLPESQISPMTRIQIARDVAMANAVVQAHENAKPVNPTLSNAAPSNTAPPNTALATAAAAAKTVVLLAGSGHVDRTLGVPQHLPPSLKVKSVLMVAGSASDAADRAADFDVVWSAAAVPPQDYCAGLKEKIKG